MCRTAHFRHVLTAFSFLRGHCSIRNNAGQQRRRTPGECNQRKNDCRSTTHSPSLGAKVSCEQVIPITCRCDFCNSSSRTEGITLPSSRRRPGDGRTGPAMLWRVGDRYYSLGRYSQPKSGWPWKPMNDSRHRVRHEALSRAAAYSSLDLLAFCAATALWVLSDFCARAPAEDVGHVPGLADHRDVFWSFCGLAP